MNLDSELHAMATISEALAGLERDVACRVLRWAAERIGAEGLTKSIVEVAPTAETPAKQEETADLAELIHAANPRTDAERALVVGYWFQVVEGLKDFESQPINAELKNMGYRVSNITDALTSLIQRRPSLVIQVAKSGSAKQARKRYRLTTAGIEEVRQMQSRALLAS